MYLTGLFAFKMVDPRVCHAPLQLNQVNMDLQRLSSKVKIFSPIRYTSSFNIHSKFEIGTFER